MKHHQTYRGRSVTVVLHNGQVLQDKFVETPTHRRYMILKHHGKVNMTDIKTFSHHKWQKREDV